jgi:hypothetical protein
MKNSRFHFKGTRLLFSAAIAIHAVNASGKRVAPKPVVPVIYKGIEYSAHGDGKLGAVVATDLSRGKQLWRVPIFRIHTHWWKSEEDNQWVFIGALELVGSAIVVTNEPMHCYRLDLSTRRVKNEPCA